MDHANARSAEVLIALATANKHYIEFVDVEDWMKRNFLPVFYFLKNLVIFQLNNKNALHRRMRRTGMTDMRGKLYVHHHSGLDWAVPESTTMTRVLPCAEDIGRSALPSHLKLRFKRRSSKSCLGAELSFSSLIYACATSLF